MKRATRFFNICDNFYWKSGVSADVPALAYYLLISLAPFLLGVTAMAARVFDTDQIIADITVKASSELPWQLKASLIEIIEHAQQSSGWLLLLAVIGCLWTCSGAVGVIVRCKHRLLGRPAYHPTLARLREIGLAGLVVLLVVLLAAMAAVGGGLTDRLKIDFSSIELSALTWAASLIILEMLYILGPRGKISLRAALSGALPASILLQVVPLVIALYTNYAIGAVNVAQLFFTLVLLVVAATLSAQIILIGATLACMKSRGIKLRQLSDLNLAD